MTHVVRYLVASLALIVGCAPSDPGCPDIFVDGNIVYVEWLELTGNCGTLDPFEVDTGLVGVDDADQCADAEPIGNPVDEMCTWDLTSECADVYGSWTFVGQLEYVGDDPDTFEGPVTFRRYDTEGNIVCQGTYEIRYADKLGGLRPEVILSRTSIAKIIG